MRAVVRRAALLATVAATATAALATAGCASSAPAAPEPSASTVSTPPRDPRAQLAGLAAAAKDRRFFAGYTLTRGGGAPRTVLAVLAADGSWRFDVPGGALGGQANVSVARTAHGLYQCRLGGDGLFSRPSCVKVGPAGGAPDGTTPDGAAGPTLPASIDPMVEHPFTDWLDVLTDRGAALAVAVAPPLPGVTGACYSVEPSAAALTAPMDGGIYCFDEAGTLTAARASFGTLVLSTPVSPPPPTATLPGPVTTAEPLPTAAPPPPAAPPSGTRRG